jgi:ABC-type Fe3+/spermidine/putrescine transport system ATPase subunit
MTAAALELRGLSVEYAGEPALAELQLSVAAGEMLALLGPSGSGKTTLLHTVAGFLAPTAGEVWMAGRPVATPTEMLPPEQRRVAMVFQNYALWPHLTALDTVAYPARRRGVRRKQARAEAAAILDRLHIGHLARRRPAELSGGEQQRVGLGRALAGDADLYLFDEPTAHLDTHVRGLFLEDLLERRRSTGAAALYATHDAEEALGIADRVALLNDGRLVQVGSAEEVYHRPCDWWAARLTGPASVLATEEGPVMVRPEWACLDGDRDATVRQALFRGPHSDYLLETGQGRLLIRHPGRPLLEPGDRVTWRLRQSWPLTPRPLPNSPSGKADPKTQRSSREAGPRPGTL